LIICTKYFEIDEYFVTCTMKQDRQTMKTYMNSNIIQCNHRSLDESKSLMGFV
jgi:hypothetical protein